MNAFFIFGVTMKKGQHLFIFNLIILLMIAPCAVATTLTLQIVQVDKIHSDVTDSSLLIEESIFDYLFSKGYIVTSSPVATDLENSNSSYALAVNDARSSSVDFLIYTKVFFDAENSTDPDGNLLQNIDSVQWQLIRISDNKQIASGKQSPKIINSEDNTAKGISQFGVQIAGSICSSLGRK